MEIVVGYCSMCGMPTHTESGGAIDCGCGAEIIYPDDPEVIVLDDNENNDNKEE